MRLWFALMVAACGGSPHQQVSDATAAASCDDFSGTWQFTGTETTMRFHTGDTTTQTTMTNNTFAVTLTKTDACTFQVAFDGLGVIAATASESTVTGDLEGAAPYSSGYHGTYTMSTTTLGATVGWDREAENGDQGSTTYAGSVAR